MALSEILDLLVCPLCRESLDLSADGRVVRCRGGHAFDVARQGYLNLLGGAGAPKNADTPAMIAARARFLGNGHYAPIADRLLALAALSGVAAPAVLEVGAGTGYYLARLLRGLADSRGIALDVSAAAARRAAGAHPAVGSVVADVWQQLPVADGSIDVLLDVFAPRNAAEFARVLSPTGVLLVVTPAPEHLQELRDGLGLLDIQADKLEQLQGTLSPHLTLGTQELLQLTLSLDRAAQSDLVAMGPNAFHRTPTEIEARVGSTAAPTTVSVSVNLSAWTTRHPP